jgi:hypothetical protein
VSPVPIAAFCVQAVPLKLVGWEAAQGPASEYAYQTFWPQPVLHVFESLAQISLHVYCSSLTA